MSSLVHKVETLNFLSNEDLKEIIAFRSYLIDIKCCWTIIFIWNKPSITLSSLAKPRSGLEKSYFKFSMLGSCLSFLPT